MNLSTASLVTTPTTIGTRRKLLTPLNEPGHFLLVIDNSSLERFTTCPTSARHYLVSGREAVAKNAALVFGGAIHAGLESLLLSGSVSDAQLAVANFFAAHPAPPDDYRTVENAVEIIRHYALRSSFPDYESDLLSDSNGLLVERAFELPLGVIEVNDHINMPWLNAEQHGINYTEPRQFVSHIHVAWSGRIDAVVRANGLARIMDHKTTSIAGDQFVQEFQLSNPVLGYCWAGRQLWPDLDIRGFVLNAIHFKRPTKSSSGLTDRGPRGGDAPLNFFRAYFEYSPERLEWWHNNTLSIVSDFIHCLVRDHFPAHTKWCFGKYGQCPYHIVCCEDNPSMQSSLLSSTMFSDVTWNPVK